jgi:2-(1,2-epoxy-1,2-dihydrophenyl)acetyl-CoA isomerase
VNEVVEADRLLEHVGELARTYASLPTKAIGMTKRLFDHAEHATLDEQLELEAELQSAATQTSDFREGVNAFLEKRAASFSGL